MRHFVHGTDGEKYGPADLQTLVQWRAEGRISPTTLLEEETGGVPFEAQRLPGLFSPATDDRAFFTNYPRPVPTQINFARLAVWSWISATLSLFFCPVGLGALAIVLATKAKQGGYSRGSLLLGYAWLCLVVGLGLAFVALRVGGLTRG